MSDNTPSQKLEPGVCVTPIHTQGGGKFWMKVLGTFVIVVLMLLLVGAASENFEFRINNVKLESEIRYLRLKVEVLEDRIVELKGENKELREILSRPWEETYNGIQRWRPYEGYNWIDYAKPIAIGTAVSLGIGWLTGGLSIGGQVIVGVGGSIATKALGF